MVEQEGVACHTGHHACFFRALRDGALTEIAPVLVDPGNCMAEPDSGHRADRLPRRRQDDGC